jgi:hypothetical protein
MRRGLVTLNQTSPCTEDKITNLLGDRMRRFLGYIVVALLCFSIGASVNGARRPVSVPSHERIVRCTSPCERTPVERKGIRLAGRGRRP